MARYDYRDALHAFVRAHVPQGGILDLGSAPVSFAKSNFSNVTTFDVVPPADVIGDVCAMPFADNAWDTIVCLETLEHVKDPFMAMKEMYRVLKPGGTFIGSTPFNYELHGEEYGDYWRFTRQGWEILLKDFKDPLIRTHAGTKEMPGWYMVKATK